MNKLSFLLTFTSLFFFPIYSKADWPQFRGVNSSGKYAGKTPPIKFSPGENELWKSPLPSGHSSPCVVGDKIYLTGYDKENKKLEVICLSKKTGQRIWSYPVPFKKLEKGHPSFSPASSSPTSDGDRVVAYFGSFGLICLNTKGEKLWDIPLPLTKSYSGNATSPIIHKDKVILYRGNYVDHYLLAVNKETGKELWKVPQHEKFTPDMACSSTPILFRENLIIHSARSIQAFKIADGELIWRANCSTTGTSTPILAGDEVITATWNQTGEASLVPQFPPYEELIKNNDKNKDQKISKDEFPKLFFFHRSEGTEAPQNGYPVRFRAVDHNRNGIIDREEWAKLLEKDADRRKKYICHGLLAIKLNSKGELKEEQVRALERRGIPEVPSPVFHDGLIYFVKNGGIITCVEQKSGKLVYRKRTGGKGTHYASPLIANDKLYSISGAGTISVLTLGKKPEILAKNDMKDYTYATPAIVDGIIYVRTHGALYAFGEG